VEYSCWISFSNPKKGIDSLKNYTLAYPEAFIPLIESLSQQQYFMTSPEQNLAQLGLILPPAPKPLGVYMPSLVVGNFLYLSGHGTVTQDGSLIIGRIGEDLDIEQGKLAARQVGLAMLATIKESIGSLDKVKRVIKVLGMVNCVSSFERHPNVINGCSELFAAVCGKEMCIGVRSAVVMGSLPDNIPVEIEGLFELH
jgi:enamine deaminase RidA (YjgF/YER057c/UK114 family)